MADYLSRLKDRSHVVENRHIRKEFLHKQLLALNITKILWYADIVNLSLNGMYPPKAMSQQKKKLCFDSRSYV